MGPPRCRLPGSRLHRTIKLTDALIAATAVEHGLPVVSQDGDFVKIAAAHPPLRTLAA
jgi:predicted nucleic acid-binding protein